MGLHVVVLNLHLLLCFRLVYLASVHIITVFGTLSFVLAPTQLLNHPGYF